MGKWRRQLPLLCASHMRNSMVRAIDAKRRRVSASGVHVGSSVMAVPRQAGSLPFSSEAGRRLYLEGMVSS